MEGFDARSFQPSELVHSTRRIALSASIRGADRVRRSGAAVVDEGILGSVFIFDRRREFAVGGSTSINRFAARCWR